MRANDPAAPWLLPTRPRASGEHWAEDAWRMWHQKEPREMVETTYDFPEEVVPVGKAQRILYSSDKWEEDGDFYTYFHDFDSHPMVYAPSTSSWAKKRENRGSRPLDVARTLKMEHVDDELQLPLLAKTLELIIVDGEGKKQSRKFRGQTPLCCTSDLKTLLVLASDGPIIIRGGQMVVTERGIVK
jgi:hypothetical protein